MYDMHTLEDIISTSNSTVELAVSIMVFESGKERGECLLWIVPKFGSAADGRLRN